MNLTLLTEYQIWGDRKVITLLETLTEEEYYSNLGENIGSIHTKCAHIVSVYDFLIKIFEDTPLSSFPDMTGLSKNEILKKWKYVHQRWLKFLQNQKEGLFGLPLANGQRVDVVHIYYDAFLHTIHHRAQILMALRLLGKDKEAVHPRDTNIDYLLYLFSEHRNLIQLPLMKKGDE